MNKIALITGITGQDAALLAKFLLEKEYIVYGMMRRTSSPTDWRIKELGLYDNPHFNIVSGDMSDQSSLDRIVSSVYPDEIYNLAAQSFVGSSWDLAESTMDITGVGPMRLFESVRKFCKDTKIYQASSSEMFGSANRHEILNEQSSFCPRSPYGVAKCAAHYSAKVYRESYGMFISCGILFNHDSEWRGEEFVTRKISLEVAKILLGLTNSISLGNLEAQRDFGYAPDYVEAMYLMLQMDNPSDFVIATGKSYTIESMCKWAFESIGINDYKKYIKIDPRFMRPADVGCLIGNASLAKEKLGWQPKIFAEEIMYKMVSKDIQRLQK